ncbi:MAG: 2Fe-2S iron-sulfur cluster-binding protein [Pyrinomonadaceae bacterium]
MSNALTDYLSKFSEADWLAAVDELLPCVHDVDKDALQIWFRFYPLDLKRYLDTTEDRAAAELGVALQGKFGLEDKIDSSHSFLYGHRHWKTVKAAIEAETVVFKDETPTLIEEVKAIGMAVAEKLHVERQMINAMVIIGLATLNQVGVDAFKAAAGEVEQPTGIMAKSPNAVIAERAKDDSQGVFGFLKSVDKKFSVAWQNAAGSGKFAVVNDQEVSSGSSADRSQNWQKTDERCWEGVIPVECVAASCGTCWVGVLGGAEKLTAVSRRERRAMEVFGYNQPEGDHPNLRLACQAKATGNATIVIPAWNAVFGKKVRGNVEDVVLEPNTTSAQKLREVVKSAVSGE